MARKEEQGLWIRVVVAAIVVFVGLTLVAAAAIVGTDVRSPLPPAAGDAAAAAGGPQRPPGAGPTPTGDPTVDSQLADIASFVENQRGLQFQKPVTVQVLADGPFQDRLLASANQDEQDLLTQAQALQALGFVDRVDQVDQGERALLAAGVLGFYDPHTKELVVRGGGFTPMTRQTIAHELTHALDDQWFDLANPAYDEHDDELGFGITALAEGNARRVDEAYAADLDDADRQTLQQEQAQVPPPPSSVPPILVDLLQAPYDEGEPLVRAILKHGGQTALDDAFRMPPRTSEQVIDPNKFFAGEAAVPVSAPPADGAVSDQGMFGELMLRELLGRALGKGRVQRASSGWGGDHYVVWPRGPQYCVRVDFAADTPTDLSEMHKALQDTASTTGATVDEPSADLVRYTSCH